MTPPNPDVCHPVCHPVRSQGPASRGYSHSLLALAALTLLVLTGCHHKTQVAYQPPPPPARSTTHHSTATTTAHTAPPPRPPAGSPHESDLHGKPTLVETGMASWYGPQFNHKKSSDGQVYDQNAMTAAHRTLPLGSLARVTNLATNESVIVRITDRGPFVHGRVLDLSEGAAKQIGLYRMGVAKVKVEAFMPATATVAGTWCVQTGAFQTAQDALDLKDALLKRYATAKVQEFQGPTGFWVRIDPAGRGHTQASAIQDWIGRPDDHAESYLVRLD
jgi:rare lipoprotein A